LHSKSQEKPLNQKRKAALTKRSNNSWTVTTKYSNNSRLLSLSANDEQHIVVFMAAAANK